MYILMLVKRLSLFAIVMATIAFLVVLDLKAINKKHENDYVTFDLVKYAGSASEISDNLTDLITKHAGNRVVVIKQTVLKTEQLPDITHEIMMELGLEPMQKKHP